MRQENDHKVEKNRKVATKARMAHLANPKDGPKEVGEVGSNKLKRLHAVLDRGGHEGDQ